LASCGSVRHKSVLILSDLPKLATREWVAKCLGMMNDSNREVASAELKKAIKDAHAKNELSTIDWSTVELER